MASISTVEEWNAGVTLLQRTGIRGFRAWTALQVPITSGVGTDPSYWCRGEGNNGNGAVIYLVNDSDAPRGYGFYDEAAGGNFDHGIAAFCLFPLPTPSPTPTASETPSVSPTPSSSPSASPSSSPTPALSSPSVPASPSASPTASQAPPLRLGKGSLCTRDAGCLSDTCLGGCCCSIVAAADPDCVACRCGEDAGGCYKRIPTPTDVCVGDEDALPFNLRVLPASSPLNSRGEDLIVISSRYCGDVEGTPLQCPRSGSGAGGGGGGGQQEGGGEDDTSTESATSIDIDGATYYVVGAADDLNMRASTCND